MTDKPATYHAHEGSEYVHWDEHGCRNSNDAYPVARIDPRPDSDDMQRLLGLLEWDDLGVLSTALKEAFTRYAAGESAEPPVVTFQPGQRVRFKEPGSAVLIVTQDGFVSTVTWKHHHRGPLTSERYELVGGGL